MSRRNRRAVSPVVGVVLMFAVAALLAATVGSAVIGTVDTQQRTPAVATSAGSFDTGPSVGCGDNVVRLRHVGGDPVPADELAIAVRLPEAATEARIDDLPVPGTALTAATVRDPDNAVYDYCAGGVIAGGGRRWTAGRAIAFRLNAGGGTVEPGDSIEVRVVHAPTDGVLAEVRLTAGS